MLRSQVRVSPLTELHALAAWPRVSTNNWLDRIPNGVFMGQFVLHLEVQTLSQQTSCNRKLPEESHGLHNPSTNMQMHQHTVIVMCMR